MIYVTSDLHGNYDGYQKLLEKINFSDDDTLIINGDICDRGPDSAKIYVDVMARNNVFAIKGNHEYMAEEPLKIVLKEFLNKEIDISFLMSKPVFWDWIDNGGVSTLSSLLDLDQQTRLKIYSFIKAMPYYKTVFVNNKRYVILHGGISANVRLSDLDNLDPHDIVWTRPDFDLTYFNNENTYLIVGHTPTLLIKDVPEGTIYRGKGNLINIDCGAAYPTYGGRIGCLCLDTDEEIYI